MKAIKDQITEHRLDILDIAQKHGVTDVRIFGSILDEDSH